MTSLLQQIQIHACFQFTDGIVVTISSPFVRKGFRGGEFFTEEEAKDAIENVTQHMIEMMEENPIHKLHGEIASKIYMDEFLTDKQIKPDEPFSNN